MRVAASAGDFARFLHACNFITAQPGTSPRSSFTRESRSKSRRMRAIVVRVRDRGREFSTAGLHDSVATTRRMCRHAAGARRHPDRAPLCRGHATTTLGRGGDGSPTTPAAGMLNP